jgi:glycosyltransferase involved in cell wall biosynthesis
MKKRKIMRITTVPVSLLILLKEQLKFMNQHYEVIGVSSDGPELSMVAEQEGIRTIPVSMTRTISPLQDLNSLWQLIQLFKKEKPFIVHTHTPKAGIVGMVAAKIAGVPNRLHTVAGLPLLEATGRKRTVLNFVEKMTYSCATHVYPNSKGLHNIILKNKYCAADKLSVLANGSSNGINTDHFDPAKYDAAAKAELMAELGIKPSDFVFVFVGRLVGDKGINELVEAFLQVKMLTANVKLLLVGRVEAHLDPLKPETKSIIERDTDIIAVGGQRDVRPYLAISNALAFPSYREGFPNVVLQAGAMGLPSIVSNINGCNEIIIDRENGIITPVKDATALTAAMLEVVRDQNLYSSMAHKAREMIITRYNQQVVWNAILNEYEKLEGDVQKVF